LVQGFLLLQPRRSSALICNTATGRQEAEFKYLLCSINWGTLYKQTYKHWKAGGYFAAFRLLSQFGLLKKRAS
jgi:hypothetical protein